MNFLAQGDGKRRNLLILLTSMALTVGLLSPAAATAEVADTPAAAAAQDPQFLDSGWEDARSMEWWYQPKYYAGSMYWVAQEITGAAEYWNDEYTGEGVDVALIDSGVVPVDGLDSTNKVINGIDLSFESQADNLRYLDTYGHGTHMAGIIAGRSSEVESDDIQKGEDEGFLGMAPNSRIVNVKVADNNGAVDVSQIIAAITWVVEHKNDHGMNIRVLNLSYGTDSFQDADIDPLAFAVERAWKAGIVVVVAAGNDGNSSPLRDPAVNPYVIAVGASDSKMSYSAHDDTVPSFSSCGTSGRHLDVVAPGQSIVSLRNPGSHADVNYPEAAVGEQFFLGSGTSQAAAVVSGAVALIIEQRPNITPDQVKALLMQTAQPLPKAKGFCQGAGLIDLKEARGTNTPQATQNYAAATGMGSLEGARGSDHLSVDGVTLEGEQDIFGGEWDPESFVRYALRETSFVGEDWNGTSWSGTSWSGTSWSGTSWSDYVWSDYVWSGTSWSGTSWSGTSWSGTSWSGTSWSDSMWLGLSWG
ncbi:MAG: S8 family serine peptidase [bacterium]|nr:S8 family serine peptidase [bacterium]